MADILMMPQEVSHKALGITKRKKTSFQREIILMMNKDLSIRSDENSNSYGDEVSSLANSTGHECLESGFDTFADFLRYSYQGNTNEQAIWRRRGKFASLRWLGKMLKTSSRRLRDLLYGLCGVIAVSVTNIAVAFGVLFFLIF